MICIWDVVIVTCLLGGVFGMAAVSCERDKRLKSECLADGRKEYECTSMLRHHTTIINSPVTR